jgi:hypothetical protein
MRERNGSRTSEDDEVGFLGAEDAVEEGGGVEVGAAALLRREDVLARGAAPVRVVHVRHLQHLERPALSPEPQGAGTVGRRRDGEEQEEAEASGHAGGA